MSPETSPTNGDRAQGPTPRAASFPFGRQALPAIPSPSLARPTMATTTTSAPTAVADMPEARMEPVKTSRLDKIGAGLSVICAVKCVGIPLVAAVLPIGGAVAWAHHPAVVWSVAGLALPIAAYRLIYKEWKLGKRVTPVAAALSSIILGLGALGHSVSGHNSASSAETSDCMCGCGPDTNTSTSKNEGGIASVLQSGAHGRMIFGALGLGLLHASRFLRRRENSQKGQSASSECGGGDSCRCDS